MKSRIDDSTEGLAYGVEPGDTVLIQIIRDDVVLVDIATEITDPATIDLTEDEVFG